jgi:serine protease AprX
MFKNSFYNCLATGFAFTAVLSVVFLSSMAVADINDQVAQLDIDTANLDDIIDIFGEPVRYNWLGQTYTRDNLPDFYIVEYSDVFSIFMANGYIEELRFESPDYLFKGQIRVGSPRRAVLAVVGQPTETVVGQPCGWEDGVFYTDIDGRTGYCYYRRSDQNVRFFFENYVVSDLYLTRSTTPPPPPISSVEPFDDVRWKDLSQLDLSGQPGLIETLTYNLETIWPETNKMPTGSDPNETMTNAKNPGLGVRSLHQQGITGTGINVAIIDQPLYQDHPEYSGKVTAYYDLCGGEESSMHGPAVTSLLVGENCGTAPGAHVYYAAAPSWTADAAYQADALNWIIAQNETLPVSEKIRVVSVSAAPSGPGSPFLYNNEMWDDACVQAEAAGILVVDCTPQREITFCGYYDPNDPENVAKCTCGWPDMTVPVYTDVLHTPTSLRTLAEADDIGDCFGYTYDGHGGMSWSVPYCAGVLAMGWQVRPELTKEQIVDLLFQTAYVNPDGARIIDPPAFISLLLKNKPAIQLSNDEFEFYADSGGPNPDPQILSISNSGSGTLNWAIDETCDWLQVNPSSGFSTGQDDINEVTLSIIELPLGVHTCQLTISDPCAINNPQIVSITLYVSDANAQTIQDMIDAAEVDDTVIINPGVYIGDGNRDLDFKGKAITVRSVDPNDPDVVASTIIVCQGSESEPHRGFYFHNNEEADSVLAGFTITQGYQTRGGGIYCEHASPTISNCVLVDNSAEFGGGMHNSDSNTIVVNCTFIDNSTANWGGGMSNRDGGNPTLINCTFCGNSSTLRGGGIYSDENSSATVSNCILWENSDEGGTDEWAQIDSDGPVPLISYSCVQGWTGNFGGISNIGTDPLFADMYNGDYHLKSEYGRWDPNSQSWVKDDVTSPCIDAGDPNSDFSGETWPHGGRINIGAYGGTQEASMSLETQGLFLPRVAYIFSHRIEPAESFDSLLETYGCSTTLFRLDDVPATSLDSYDLIIVADDTQYETTWSDPNSIALIENSTKPIIGLGDGGYDFFGLLGLSIGNPNGGHSSKNSIEVVDPNCSLFSTPYSINIPQDRALQLYTETKSIGIYFWPTVPETVTGFGHEVNDVGYFPLVAEQNRYLLWGFTESPQKMTETGKKLFINVVIRTANNAW